jgi:uncharacterized membrane protein
VNKYVVTVERVLRYDITVYAESGDDAGDLGLKTFYNLTVLPETLSLDRDVVDYTLDYRPAIVTFVNKKEDV